MSHHDHDHDRATQRHATDEHPVAITTTNTTSSSSSMTVPQKNECTLYFLVQYECDLSPANIVCRPIYRIMKRCKGRPTVEVTPLYDPLGNILQS